MVWIELDNVVDKYVVCVLLGEDVVGYLKKGKMDDLLKWYFIFWGVIKMVYVVLLWGVDLLILEMEKVCKCCVFYILWGRKYLLKFFRNSF